jgi:outer membrane protein OmpA-like peptidoglycan-associated protein/tetratricopeptide (TPR) repeat protein
MKTKLFIFTLVISLPVLAQDTIQESTFKQKTDELIKQVKSLFERKTPEEKGDLMYDYYNFTKASFYYEQADSLSTSALRKLGDSYLKLASYDLAMVTYQKLVDRSDCNPSDLYNYANILKMNGSYEDADNWMKRYADKAPNEKRAKVNTKVYEKSASLMKDQGIFQLTNCGMNSALQEFASGMYYDQLVYSASTPRKGPIIKEYLWTNETFLDLYLAEIDGDTVQTFNALVPSFNKKYHEGPVAFSGDHSKMFFTANNYERQKGLDGKINLQLYYSEKDLDGNWTEPTAFKYNNRDYSIGHPSLTADGKTLFFSSNMPGGYGGADLYKCSLLDSGWSAPINLGPNINTEGDELFPNYIEKSHLLIFSSNGHYGLGGLDIYLASLKVEKFIRPSNLGAPLNSAADDFGFFLTSTQKSGYVSSNRKTDGKGNDDIYYVKLLKELPNPWKEIKGIASNNFGRSLANTKINFRNESGDYIDSVVTDANGKYSVNLPTGMKFTIDVTKPSYRSLTNLLSTNTTDNTLSLNPVLDHRVIIKGHVSSSTKNEPLSNTTVSLYTKDFEFIDSVKTGVDGSYLFDVFDKKDFAVVSNKYNFFSDTSFVSSEEINDVIETELAMAQILPDGVYSVEDEVFLKVRTIYFDWNSSNLRADKSVLDEVIKILNDFPNLEIELGSHTDCRGSKAYNQKLSDARARASSGYIRARISNPRRIHARGYGENKLVNDCECEGTRIVPCSEEDHQMNRRTEFKIIKK